MHDIEAYLTDNRDRFEDELRAFLCIPSVSAEPDHADDVARCAEHVAGLVREAGLEATVHPTDGHPVVVGQRVESPTKPTLLIYGHYDVQPADPLAEWTSPPFEPTVREGNIHARGASDDKGQMLAHVKALEAWTRVRGSLPINVTCVFEGEEEIGSPNLTTFVPGHRDLLAADVGVVSDGEQFADGIPSITYGLRGLAYFEVTLTGAKQDLHSGTFGGAVDNPANVAAALAASLKDADGRISVPGFYDDVVPLTDEERNAWASLPFDEEAFRREWGVPALAGEAGYTALERRWARPTCDLNGLYGGYTGEGAKTVLPARAGFKVSFRLVPHQDPDRIEAAFRSHVEGLCPPSVRCRIRSFHGSRAVLVPTDSPGMQAARRAVAIGFGREPVLTRMGGSIPIINAFKDSLGLDMLMIGFGLPDDAPHSPNEKFRLADLHRGIRTAAQLIEELGKA